MSKLKITLLAGTALIIIMVVYFASFYSKSTTFPNVTFKNRFFEVQSIDTMKYSRDTAREMLQKPEFDQVIDQQTRQIAETGATHIAIATPYDEEFIPFLQRWVDTARKYKLNVWFRGNLSGWEGWFDYPKISREQHKEDINKFITQNPYLFEDGDIFTSCPECENGGPGDPRHNGDAEGHKKFLIEEYQITKNAFKNIKKNVKSNYFSMNGDVARLIMDRETTTALDWVVVIDHYVFSPEQTVRDTKEIAEASGGKIVLGEFGMPIPDIHGQVSEDQQAQWIQSLLSQLAYTEELIGVNYWTSVGGSTELWESNGNEKKAVKALKTYFNPQVLQGLVVNSLNKPIKNASININGTSTLVNQKGSFIVTYVGDKGNIDISAPGYKSQSHLITSAQDEIKITLKAEKQDILTFIKMFFSR